MTGCTYGNLDGEINHGDMDIFLIKFNQQGEKLWTILEGTTAYDV